MNTSDLDWCCTTLAIQNMVIAPEIGGILGEAVGEITSDWLILKLFRRNKGICEPETQLQIVYRAIVPPVFAANYSYRSCSPRL